MWKIESALCLCLCLCVCMHQFQCNVTSYLSQSFPSKPRSLCLFNNFRLPPRKFFEHSLLHYFVIAFHFVTLLFTICMHVCMQGFFPSSSLFGFFLSCACVSVATHITCIIILVSLIKSTRTLARILLYNTLNMICIFANSSQSSHPSIEFEILIRSISIWMMFAFLALTQVQFDFQIRNNLSLPPDISFLRNLSAKATKMWTDSFVCTCKNTHTRSK